MASLLRVCVSPLLQSEAARLVVGLVEDLEVVGVAMCTSLGRITVHPDNIEISVQTRPRFGDLWSIGAPLNPAIQTVRINTLGRVNDRAAGKIVGRLIGGSTNGVVKNNASTCKTGSKPLAQYLRWLVPTVIPLRRLIAIAIDKLAHDVL